MYSHIMLGVQDFERAFSFYSAILAPLQLTLRFCERDVPWAGWQQRDLAWPEFIITAPFNGEPATPGNGQMTAFIAETREQVDEVYRLACSIGAVSEGEPGLRPRYEPDYYGAYFRDPDGNKLHVCCRRPAA
ncbi:VOC family protein [Pantoea sp.]|uniref:VOC family protein n=1 Tax=Pantoea sp. TaxID=69393 RepID=UPI00289B3CEA|nr:VOC family protein [Pantoea sp.]